MIINTLSLLLKHISKEKATHILIVSDDSHLSLHEIYPRIHRALGPVYHDLQNLHPDHALRPSRW